ncbi:MAG: glycosyl transferase, partial [Pseudomonadota bacterium]
MLAQLSDPAHETATHGPETITIVGSGPSVAGQDLSGIDPSGCILLNGAIGLASGPLAGSWQFAIEDERFVWRHFDIIEAAPPRIGAMLSVQAIRAIAEISPRWFDGRKIVLIDNVLKPYGTPRLGPEDLAKLS